MKKLKILYIACKMVIIIFISFLILNFRICKVEQNSMYPDLKDGQIILVRTTPFQKYDVNDVIVFRKQNTILVKRIIATSERPTIIFTPPEKHYAVAGDHVSQSIDSKNWVEPYVKENEIIGKVIFKFSKEGVDEKR